MASAAAAATVRPWARRNGGRCSGHTGSRGDRVVSGDPPAGYHQAVIVLVLLIAAAILAGLATFGIGRWNLLAAAFCCYVLSVLLPGLGVG